MILCRMFPSDFGVAADDHQESVEVVSYAASQTSDGSIFWA